MDFNSLMENGAGWAAGGMGIAFAFSKLRSVFASDSANSAASKASEAASHAQQTVIEQLQRENERLHKSIQELQQQVAALQHLVAELTTKITRSEITAEQQAQIDELARSGRIERRRSVITHTKTTTTTK